MPAPQITTSAARSLIVAAGSVDPALAPPPVGLAELALEELARRVARQGLREVHGRRPFEGGQALPREGDELRGPRVGARRPHDDGLDRLAPPLARHAAHPDARDRPAGA